MAAGYRLAPAGLREAVNILMLYAKQRQRWRWRCSRLWLVRSYSHGDPGGGLSILHWYYASG